MTMRLLLLCRKKDDFFKPSLAAFRKIKKSYLTRSHNFEWSLLPTPYGTFTGSWILLVQ